MGKKKQTKPEHSIELGKKIAISGKTGHGRTVVNDHGKEFEITNLQVDSPYFYLDSRQGDWAELTSLRDKFKVWCFMNADCHFRIDSVLA